MNFLGDEWKSHAALEGAEALKRLQKKEKEQKAAERVRLIPVEPDCRSYTDRFECTGCGCIVHIGTYEQECDYEFCPYCGKQT